MSPSETLNQVQKVGRERLYPSLSNPNWLVLRKRRQIFQRALESVPGRTLSVLDVGGRIQPYRVMLGDRCAKYIAVDLRVTPLVDVVAQAQQLPFKDHSFDLAFCTQMLEYAPEPGRVISEIYRVLRPGGVCLLSVPSLAVRDSDDDRWRFWPAGIRQLAHGFSQVEIFPEGGSIAGFFRTVNGGLFLLAKLQAARTALSLSVVPLLNLAGLSLENLIGSHNDAFAVNYSVLMRRELPTAKPNV